MRSDGFIDAPRLDNFGGLLLAILVAFIIVVLVQAYSDRRAR